MAENKENPKQWVIYRVRAGRVEYLLTEGTDPSLQQWSVYENTAVRFTQDHAHKLAMKWNRQLDAGARKIYGWTYRP